MCQNLREAKLLCDNNKLGYQSFYIYRKLCDLYAIDSANLNYNMKVLAKELAFSTYTFKKALKLLENCDYLTIENEKIRLKDVELPAAQVQPEPEPEGPRPEIKAQQIPKLPPKTVCVAKQNTNGMNATMPEWHIIVINKLSKKYHKPFVLQKYEDLKKYNLTSSGSFPTTQNSLYKALIKFINNHFGEKPKSKELFIAEQVQKVEKGKVDIKIQEIKAAKEEKRIKEIETEEQQQLRTLFDFAAEQEIEIKKREQLKELVNRYCCFYYNGIKASFMFSYLFGLINKYYDRNEL